MFRQEEEEMMLWKMHKEDIIKQNAMKAKNSQMNMLQSGLLLKIGGMIAQQKEEEHECDHEGHPCDREFNPAKDQEHFMKHYKFNIIHQDYELRIKFKDNDHEMKWFKLNRP